MKKAVLIVFLLLLKVCIFTSYAQINIEYSPTGNVLENKRVELWASNPSGVLRMDYNSRIKEGEQKRERGEIPSNAYGFVSEENINISDGEWYNAKDGRVWTLSISSEGAKGLAFYFKDIVLPDDAELYIVNKERTTICGPLMKRNCNTGKQLFIEMIAGSEVTLYLFEPLEYIGKSKLTIEKVVHGFRDLDEASPCNMEVVDYPAYSKETYAIGKLHYFLGAYSCDASGALVMTTDHSFKSYLLTAFHAFDADGNGQISDAEKANINYCSVVFHLMHAASGNSNLYTSYYPYTGGTYRAGWNSTDFALLELNPTMINNTNLKWLGWDRSGNTPTKGACLHHPRGDVMKISIENDPFTTSDWNGSSVYNHWQVIFDEGITETGSSGAPILDQNHRVVGNLHGGLATIACNDTLAVFGKFSLSWTGGGTNDTRLSNWLDPDNTGITVQRSSFDIDIIGQNTIYNSNVYTTSSIPSFYSVAWYLSGANASCFTVQNNTPAINQCTITQKDSVDFVSTNDLVLNAYITYDYTPVNTVSKTLTPVYIKGPTIPCTTEMYEIGNLPDSCTVNWNWSGTGLTIDSTPIMVEPYYSTNNYFKLVRSNQAYVKGTITATIQKNGSTLTTMTKTINTGVNFSGTWYQGSGSSSTLTCGNMYSITDGSQVVLQSSDFVGKTVSSSCNGLLLLGGVTHSGSTISFTPIIPFLEDLNGGPNFAKSVTITVKDTNTCETYEFTFQSGFHPLTSSSCMNIASSGSEYTFTLDESSDSRQAWTIEIINYETGRTVYKGMSNTASHMVNTSGWKSGIYIVAAKIGTEVISQKLTIQ